MSPCENIPAEEGIEDDGSNEGILICSCPALLKASKNFIAYF
jgi:hypothetical protein